MINGFTQMVAGSLGLTEPWYISGAEFDSDKQQVHIYASMIYLIAGKLELAVPKPF